MPARARELYAGQILVSGAEAGVDDPGLLGVEDEGVDGQEPESGNLGVVADDRDVADPGGRVWGLSPASQKGTWVASSPRGWAPLGPGRPEMTRQKSVASIAIS